MSEQTFPPDILTLMDTIRKQAQEYTAAFSSLDNERSALTKLKDDVMRDVEEFRARGDFLLNNVHTMANETLASVEKKTKTVEIIYSELDNIRNLSESLQKLKIVLDARDAELSAMLQSSKAVIAKQVDQGLEKAQLKLDGMMEKAQTRIAAFDQKVAALQDQQRRMFTILGDDVQSLKDAQSRQELPLKNDISRMRTEIELFKEEIKNGVDAMSQSSSGHNTITRKEYEPLSEDKVRKDLDFHRRKTDQVQVQVQTMENRINISLGVALFAIAITIVSVLGVAFKWFK